MSERSTKERTEYFTFIIIYTMYIIYGLENQNSNPIKVSYFYLVNLYLCNAKFSVPNQSVYT